jgi:hypothetical protein
MRLSKGLSICRWNRSYQASSRMRPGSFLHTVATAMLEPPKGRLPRPSNDSSQVVSPHALTPEECGNHGCGLVAFTHLFK